MSSNVLEWDEVSNKFHLNLNPTWMLKKIPQRFNKDFFLLYILQAFNEMRVRSRWWIDVDLEGQGTELFQAAPATSRQEKWC